MTWRVVVTRDRTIEDGAGEHRHELVVQELAYPPIECATQAEAEATARRIRNAESDPTADVAVEPPAGHRPPPGPHRLDDRARDAGRDGLARARALLRGDQ